MKPGSPVFETRLHEGAVVETTHVFGQSLVGTLTLPSAVPRMAAALILLNAGLVQRSGPFRLYTQLAREVAAAGHAVFRIDQAGLGDSPSSREARSELRREQLVAALDTVASLAGSRHFVLGGLCAGADDAFNLAHADPRITGLLLLDGPAYRTLGYRVRHYVPRLDPRRAVRSMLRRLRSIGAGVPAVVADEDLREFPALPEATRSLGTMVGQGANILFVYTGGVATYFNHARQVEECFGAVARSPRVVVEYWPDCDHTFYLARDKKRLCAATTHWMRTCFPA